MIHLKKRIMIDLQNLEILTKTFDELPVGVGIFQVPDFDDLKSIRYVYMNNVILYEMRKEKEEVIGKKIIEVAPEAFEHEGGRLVMETYRNIARDGGSINLGLVNYSNEMVAGTYECSIHHIQDDYVYIMLRNVTELEQTKNELEAKNNELNQMTNIVSHDLKDPITTIISIIQIVEDQYKKKLDDQGKNLLHLITKSAERMRTLISDLLDYGNIGQEKEKVTVDLNELIAMIQEDLNSKIKDNNVSIDIGKLPTIEGHKTELRLLFQNLISNAIKFSKPDEDPAIKISAKKTDHCIVSIQDNGIGIPEDQINKIFNIFERLNGFKYEGSGIGLAHCKKIIEQHGGEISVESKLGEGSTFHITLPN